jgi:hypothetical protein
MACVKIGTGEIIYYRGEYAIEQIYCIYCDQCGSFDIGENKPDSLSKRVMIGVMILLTSVVVYALASSGEFCLTSGILMMTLLLILFITNDAISFGKKCQKCGNIHISKGNNLLNLPENDQSILDIPIEKVLKLSNLE